MSESKHFLITGGNNGIGLSLARECILKEHKVSILCRTINDNICSLKQFCDGLGRRPSVLQCDVTDYEEARDTFEFVESIDGFVDVLVNAVGSYERKGILKASVQNWEDMFRSNLFSALHMSKIASEGMEKRGWGRIINFGIAGVEKLEARPMIAAHYAAKLGVLSMTKSMALAYHIAFDGAFELP